MADVRWLGFALGVVVVVGTFTVVVLSVVLPRAVGGRARRPLLFVNRAVLHVFTLVARAARTYEGKDAVLSPLGPVAMLANLAVWMLLLLLGYSLIMLPFADGWGAALRQVAVSMTTLGFGDPSERHDTAPLVAAAITGPLVIALQIAYLPAIYQAFNRRETQVTMLESRAGSPAWGPELLIRHELVGIADTLPELYDRWEQWSAEVAESHTTYPVLVMFRSPQPWDSWPVSLIAVLDAAALHLALAPETAPSQARLCLRMGFTCLRRIATTLAWPFNQDPLPEDPILLTYAEFADAVHRLAEVGFPMQRSAEEAWPHFKGWRTNYEEIAYHLADRVLAPPAPWTGARQKLRGPAEAPHRPPHRSPGGRAIAYDQYRPMRADDAEGAPR